MDPTHFPPHGFPSIPPPQPPLPLPLPLPPPPPADLATTISQLKSLLSFASSTLSSLPFPSPPLHSPPLLPCPYNPHHLLPPESLYRHFLNCPSPLPPLHSIPPLKPHSQTQDNETSFPPTCSDSDSDTDFVFSLESEIGDLGSMFIYKDCPGVVSSVPELAKSFTLPGFLLSECGNLTTSENDASSCKFASILPSEYWVLRSEVDAWQSFPVSYSYTALRAILGFTTVSEGDLKKWVISNSPKYGIIIDVAVRDHIWFLLKVCLKAVRREALCSLDTFFRNDGVSDPKVLISCPKLAGGFSWLSNQLSILYGEVHARSFSLGMIKEAILRSGCCILVSEFDERDEETDVRKSGEVASEGACNGNVLVSDVACAIGALHQRAFLEQNIRALRSTQSVPKHHRLMEYAYLSSRAAEERSKRPNYRPISDHDSLPSSRAQNQESGGSKTKEELLAEERDYKRRRTSYRGKKVKRSPTEVLRDIIEEHMEVIKQAGGIWSHQTSTEHTSSKPDNSQKSSALDPYSFHKSPSPNHENSYKRSKYEREDTADTYYSRSYKEYDDWHTGKEKRRDDADYYSSRSHSKHEGRYRSKDKGRDHHSRRNDTYEDGEKKRRHHRYDGQR
ncbi:hypothetical protein LUZ61_001061 [Rhynchospora tenuis]|uniref:CHHC U11-48K-type domain-containing protein n=1 Tax=Rhynchospora tenuis TaxID=198213 RepID=A0AAD5ZGI5_9POAL|nr:hypothetical protein LUZ61_001061 [Rhynchospora tenuis]